MSAQRALFLCIFLGYCLTRCARISLVTKPSVFRNFLSLLSLESTVCSVFLDCALLIPFLCFVFISRLSNFDIQYTFYIKAAIQGLTKMRKKLTTK